MIKVKRLKNIFIGDKILWSVYFVLMFLSVVFVYASMGRLVAGIGSGGYLSLLFKHCFHLLIGFGCCYVVHKIDYRKFTRVQGLLLTVSIVLLIVTLIISKITHDPTAARWIRIPVLGQFQPSEIAKYVLIFYISGQLAAAKDKVSSKETYWSVFIPVAFVTLLIFFENFSTAALIFVTCFLLMFIGGVNRRLWTYTLLVLLGTALLMFFLAKVAPHSLDFLPRWSTWVNRVNNFGSGDYTEINQQNDALTAVATGGLVGTGIGHSKQTYFLHEGHNDFIFSIILEEGGIWLGILIVLLYVTLLYRILIRIPQRTEGTFGRLACVGMGMVLGLQTVINMSVAVGIVPVTGQTLPFISYGGTSFIFASIFLGVVLNISAKSGESDIRKEELQAEETEVAPQREQSQMTEDRTS